MMGREIGGIYGRLFCSAATCVRPVPLKQIYKSDVHVILLFVKAIAVDCYALCESIWTTDKTSHPRISVTTKLYD